MNKPFVYFDIGKTILDFSDGLLELSIVFNTSLDHATDVFLKYEEDVCRGNLQPNDLLVKYEHEFDQKSKISDFTEWWALFFTPIKETFDLIDTLEKADYSLGILSNIYPELYPTLLSNNVIPDTDWDALILSCDHGYVKPEKELFEIAQTKANTEEIFLIDDLNINIEGAKSFGWTGYIFDKENPNKSVLDIHEILGIS